MRNPLAVMRIRPMQFGRYDPTSNTFGMVRVNHSRAHQGWDLLTPPGSVAYAICDGELSSGYSTDYGRWMLLRFEQGGAVRFAFYAHLQAVLVGNCSVREGAAIALTGTSGNAADIPADEAHLHFEIRTEAHVGRGLHGRIDPGEVLGYQVYRCEA